MNKGKNEGITLIALVITIIVLLILAGVAIVTLSGESGLLTRTGQTNRKQEIAEGKEIIQLAINEMQIEKKSNLENLSLEDLVNLPIYEAKVQSANFEENFIIANYMGKYLYKIDDKFNVTYYDESELPEAEEEIETGKLSDTEYRINNTTLTFGAIVEVGASETYKTVKEGLDYLCDNGYKENGAIVLKEGTYDTQDVHTGNSYVFNSKYNEMTVSIIADKPGKTFMTSGEMGEDQNNNSYWIKLRFYRIIFTTPVYSDAGSDGFHLNSDNEPNEYYNCVFIPAVGGYNGRNKTASINVYNSLFLGGANTHYTNNPLSGTAVNCASKDTAISPSKGTRTTCLINRRFDEEYNIISSRWKYAGTGENPDGTQANIGVYGGEFAWDYIDINEDKENSKITISTKCYFIDPIKQIKYIKGKVLQSEVENNGTNLQIKNKEAVIQNAEKSVFYTVLFTTESGEKIVKYIETSGEYKINNTMLRYDKMVVVGQDEEFKTVKEGLDYLYDKGYEDNGAILLKEGSYNTSNIHNGYSNNINSKYNEMEVSIIADKPGRTFVTSGEMMIVENNNTNRIKLKFYRVVFTATPTTGGYLHLGGDNYGNEYYNCVFNYPVGGWNGAVNDAFVNVYNCLFLGGANDLYISKALSGVAVNCASVDTTIEPRNGTKTTCLTNIKVGDEYNIISNGWKHVGTGTNPDGTQANIGVYGGEYAWNYIEISEDSSNSKLNINTKNHFDRIKQIKYLKGTFNANYVSSNGSKLVITNNQAVINGIEKGCCYTLLFTTQSGENILRQVHTSGAISSTEQKINNTTLTFNKIVIVGENETYTTIKAALDYLCDNGFKENSAIIVKEGYYNTSDIHNGNSSNINSKYRGMSVSVIADKPEDTYITGGEMMVVENNNSYRIGLKFYRVVFVAPPNSGFFHMGGDNTGNEYYNCVFTTPIGGWNGAVSNAFVNSYNCLFLGGAESRYTSNPLSGTAINSASTDTTIEPKNGTQTTCLTNVSVDRKYNITSNGWENAGTGTNPDGTQANIGIYGGEFAW